MEIGQRFQVRQGSVWRAAKVEAVGSILNRGRIPTVTFSVDGRPGRITVPERVLRHYVRPGQEPLF